MIQPIGPPTTLRMPGELPAVAPGAPGGAATPGAASVPSFGETVKEFVGGANEMALRSQATFQSFVRGEVRDLHQVALAQQEAGIAVRLVTEMRDKLLQSYQEVMRMQV